MGEDVHSRILPEINVEACELSSSYSGKCNFQF